MAQRITVTKLQKNPLQAAIAWVDARLPVIYAMIPPVLLLAIIQYCPLNFYWILGFEGLRLYLFWPVICLILAWYPVYTGRIFFQRYGRSFYFPWFTSIGVSCMIILFLRLAAIWCLEWSIFGIIIASIFLAIGILGLIVGYTIYFELWRRWWFNGKIVDSVQESVLSTKINALDGGEKERPRSWWGSLHRREILDANYRLRQAMILKAFDQTPRVNDSDLYDFFRAGIAQVDYLKENFAVEYHNEKYDHQRQSPVEILMQIIAVGLRQLQQGTVYSHGGPMNYRTQLQNWAEYTASFLGVDGSAFKSLLQRYINIAYDHHVTEALQFRGQISDICNEFTSLSSPPAMPRLQEVCAELWLVVAPETLEPEVTLDIWREMRESMQLGLAIQISDGASVDAVTVFAIRRLVDLISRLRDSLPQGQQACLGSQLVVIREAEEQVNERIDGVIEELSEDQQPGILKKSTGDQIPSWPYHEVWHTPAVRRMVCCLTLLLWVVNMGFILFCNPQTSPFHFNTVEHVKDPRKYYKPADKFDLMAHNDNWIAYGTNNHGLELINIHSRLTRERVTMSPTLDLTNGLLTGSFMALSKDQGIRQITPYTGLPLINIFPWLPPPHKWVSALPPEPIKILANELTDEGWLLAMEGAGIARYQFKSDSTGNLVRTRSWQTGSQSNANLSQVSFTQTGIWSANREGEIHFTNKKTLKEVKSRFIETPPIINLTANYDGQWACATDNKDSLWFFPPGTKHWLGPFFGEPGSNEPYLNSINDVQKARVSGNLVWLGANNGLFCYDQQQRRLYCPDPNIDNGWMEPAPLKDSASAEQKVLVAGKQGVFSVKRQDGIFKVNPLDENAVRALGISSNGNLCVYAVKNQEVRFLKDPYGDKKPTTLIPDEGWRRLDGTPRILDVRKSENGLLFITSAGAFFYKEDNHTYLDGSKSRIPAVNQFPEQVITLNTFSDLNDTDGKVVAIANNQPHLLNSSAAPGQPVWTGLDPTHVSRPVKIAQAAGIIFGLGDDGRIYRYIDPVPDAYPVKSNQNPLEAGSQPPNQVCGDLAVQNNDNWRMVFHYQGNLVSYNSSTGRISGEPLPKVCQGGNDIRQIRLANGNPVYLLQNGKVYNQEGDTLFAAAGAPFPITSITSLNSDPGKDSLLIGGPNGLVMRYRWSNGMWESLGESRIPGCDPNTNVTEIGVMNNTYFAGLSTGNTYVTKGGQWSLLPDCQRIAIDQSSSGWSLFTNGLRKLNSESALPEKLLYSGGMGSFITGTNCAYSRQIGSKIFLFTQEPRYGIYNQATDSWTSGQIPDDTAPRQFASLKEGVLALTGNKVFSITSQASRLVTDLPEDAAQPSVASNTNRFWLSYLQSGAAFIQQWDNLKKSSRKCSRGGSPPAGFDPAMTIIAVPDGTRTLLCDLAGRCVAYDDATGQWTLLRQAIDGQTVYGWIKSPIIGLLLTDANGNVIVSELSATRVFSDSTQPVSPEAYIRQIKSSLKKVIRPKEGILYAQPKFRVKRVNQAAQFEFKLGTKWTRVPVSQQGFFFDHFSSLTVTPAGKIWALSQGYLLQLKLSASGKGLVPTGTWYRTNAESIRLLPNGDLRTESPDGNVIWAETDNGLQPLQSTPKPQILASGAINGETIDWVWTYSPSGNGIVQPLNRNGNNVAFTAEGRLNNQTINDIGLFKGKLLLATTGGLVVRDAKTYQYLRIERNIKPVKFIPLAGSNRLLIRCQDGTLRVWTEDNIDTMNPSLTKITLRSGDIKWQADMAPGHATDITTISASNGRQISWSHEANGWRPGCDIVNTLRRQNSGDLALCTQQGNWPFNTSSGRAASPITEPLPSDEVSFQNSALQVKADGKMVTLQPRGGGNAFVQGRLFYENANGLAGFKDAIYLLLPGRGILRRDGAHPEKITGFWLYTSSFPRGRFELGASTEGLYISTPGADPSPMSAWDVIINNDSLRLQPSKILEKPVQVKLGPITWESPTISSLNFQPYAQTKAGRQLLSNWWGTERFAWDLVHSIGVLDTGYIVAATPIGLIAWPEGENSFKKLQLLPAAGLTTITPARRRQRTLGLLAAGTSGRFLITPGDNQSPIRMAPETNPQFDCHPKVSIERRSLGGTLPCVRMIEHWDTGDPFTPGNGKVLYNTLPEFNQAELIYQGQFIFDYGILGCPVGGSFGTSNNLWVVFSANPLQNIMTLNQVQKDPKTNQYRLGLYSVTKAPYHIKSLRSYKNGFMALDADGNWWYAPVTGRIIGNWTTIPAVKNIAALRTGDQVTVDVSNLRWTKSGQLYDGMTSPPFQITPGDYPLFASDGGSIALAFDLITSLAFNRNNQHLALGTYGGIIEGPYCKNGYDMISGKNPEIRLMFNRIEQPLFIQGVAMTTPLRNVQKVRYSLEGILYTKFSANDDNNEIACLLNGDLWRKVMASEWPEEHISYTGHTIELNQQKLFIDNRPIERNNNPSSIWIPKKITDVRGWALIPNEQSLWVLDHSHGLFKVKIGPSWFLRRSLTQ